VETSHVQQARGDAIAVLAAVQKCNLEHAVGDVGRVVKAERCTTLIRQQELAPLAGTTVSPRQHVEKHHRPRGKRGKQGAQGHAMRMSLPAHSKAVTLVEAEDQVREQHRRRCRADYGVAQLYFRVLEASYGSCLSFHRRRAPYGAVGPGA